MGWGGEERSQEGCGWGGGGKGRRGRGKEGGGGEGLEEVEQAPCRATLPPLPYTRKHACHTNLPPLPITWRHTCRTTLPPLPPLLEASTLPPRPSTGSMPAAPPYPLTRKRACWHNVHLLDYHGVLSGMLLCTASLACLTPVAFKPQASDLTSWRAET